MSGHLRSHKENYSFFKKNLLDKYECDLYISTWNVIDHNNNTKLSQKDINDELGIYSQWTKKVLIHDVEKFENSKKPIDRKLIGFWNNSNKQKKYIIKEPSRQIEENYETDNYWINRISDQWFPVSKGFSSIETPKSYDILMRHRMDICLHDFNMVFGKDIVVANPNPHAHLYRMRDHIIYGKPDHMIKFSKFYEASLDSIKKYNNFLAETVLEYCIDSLQPESDIYVDPNLCEYRNYRIRK